jgi:cell wall-associated NlpC family hydrolase
VVLWAAFFKNLKLSSNSMNQLSLNVKFFNHKMMPFFKLKTNASLVPFLLVGAIFFASCSSSRKTTVAHKEHVPETRPPERGHHNAEDISSGNGNVPENEIAIVHKTDKVISAARTYIGTPYKYGGTTRSGMDCSGLLLNSFSAVKVNLPRSSEAQSKVGTEIKMSELKAGDLVFFATGNKKKEITHVGLVTVVRSKDDIKFIHASSSLGVVETNLFSEYYQKRFRVARRVID